jgi:DNA ligase-1
MRALISLGPDGKVQAVSRNKKPWITIPHILKSLEPLFAKYPKLILDGELYNHDLKDDFDKIASLIKRTKPSAEDLKASAEMVRFYWYDICLPEKKFSERNSLLRDLYVEFGYYDIEEQKMNIVCVPSHYVTDEAGLDDLYARYLEDGYEGQMVRLNEGYQFERSWSLLKRKEWQTDEFKVLVIGEGNGNKKGQAAYAFLELPDGTTSRTNIKGTAENRIKLLQNKDALVGKWATTQYFNITPKGGLRFPYIFAIEDAPYLRVRAGRGKDN